MSDLNGRLFERRGKLFVPADFMAEEFIEKIAEGRKVLLDIKTPRSPENHAHFFAILHTAWTHLSDEYHDEEVLLDAVKIAVRHVRMVVQIDGSVKALPKSISFSAMGEEKFRLFKDRALQVLAGRLGVSVDELVNEVKAKGRNRR